MIEATPTVREETEDAPNDRQPQGDQFGIVGWLIRLLGGRVEI